MSDILSRLSARALGSPACLVRRPRYRFAEADPVADAPIGRTADRLAQALGGAVALDPPVSRTAPLTDAADTAPASSPPQTARRAATLDAAAASLTSTAPAPGSTATRSAPDLDPAVAAPVMPPAIPSIAPAVSPVIQRKARESGIGPSASPPTLPRQISHHDPIAAGQDQLERVAVADRSPRTAGDPQPSPEPPTSVRSDLPTAGPGHPAPESQAQASPSPTADMGTPDKGPPRRRTQIDSPTVATAAVEPPLRLPDRDAPTAVPAKAGIQRTPIAPPRMADWTRVRSDVRGPSAQLADRTPTQKSADRAIHIDIGRIEIAVPRASSPRRRPAPPPLKGRPRGGPES